MYAKMLVFLLLSVLLNTFYLIFFIIVSKTMRDNSSPTWLQFAKMLCNTVSLKTLLSFKIPFPEPVTKYSINIVVN